MLHTLSELKHLARHASAQDSDSMDDKGVNDNRQGTIVVAMICVLLAGREFTVWGVRYEKVKEGKVWREWCMLLPVVGFGGMCE